MAKCAFSAPHRDVSDIAMGLLRSGASAVDAMIAAAAAMSLAYPHMNGLGGDAFWLISPAGQSPRAIDGAGVALRATKAEALSGQLPTRGPGACLTLPGAVASWSLARQYAQQHLRAPALPLNELLAPAIALAAEGVGVTRTLVEACRKLSTEVKLDAPYHRQLAQSYVAPVLSEQRPLLHNPLLAATLEQLSQAGLDDFYRGEIAEQLGTALRELGVLTVPADWHDYRAEYRSPLSTPLQQGRVYNLPAPTQGFASLMILALFDRLYRPGMDEVSQIHLLVEATKVAFQLRDRYLGDPGSSGQKESQLLEPGHLDKLAGNLPARASPWGQPTQLGDTVWMGCVDQYGTMVSFIQSLYWEFGAGVMCPATGIIWNNRGSSFSLQPDHPNVLAPGKRPLHTLNPAYATFKDGRRMVYGTMGGDGQPQTQAAIYTRFAYNKLSLTEAIARGRWLLGRTWGDASNDLKIEKPLADSVAPALRALGHTVRSLPQHSETMGHAGAICLAANGDVAGATDPRSDGKALCD